MKSFSASLDSPDQGIAGLPVADELRIDGDHVGIAAVKGTYEGKRAGNSEITGTWKQEGFARPVMLMRTMEVPAVKTPTPPADQMVPSAFDQFVGQYALSPDFLDSRYARRRRPLCPSHGTADDADPGGGK